MQLKDGVYNRADIHSIDPIFPPSAPQLQAYMPEHDERYQGVEVKNGRVVRIIYETPHATTRTVSVAPVIDATPPAPEGAELDLSDARNFTIGDLQKLCKGRGLIASGTKLELLARLRPA